MPAADGGVVKGIPFRGSVRARVHASTHPFSVSRNRCNIEAIVQSNCYLQIPTTLEGSMITNTFISELLL